VVPQRRRQADVDWFDTDVDHRPRTVADLGRTAVTTCSTGELAGTVRDAGSRHHKVVVPFHFLGLPCRTFPRHVDYAVVRASAAERGHRSISRQRARRYRGPRRADWPCR
jgi:hypothetical protein